MNCCTRKNRSGKKLRFNFNPKQSDSLKLPFENAKVNRIELAENFILERPVREYMSLMGAATYFTKRPYTNNGLYYTNSRRSMIFYNKVKEYQDKKRANIIPEVV